MNGKINKKYIYPVFLLLILVTSFIVRFASFNRTPYAVGRDSYFHIIQARSFLEDGKTHAPDSSFTPYVLAFTYRITGDWARSQKLLAATLTALLSLFTYFMAIQLFKHSGEEKQNWALLLALMVSVSPTLTYISAQFLKQLFGMVSFMLFLWIMLWNIREDEINKNKKETLVHQLMRRGVMFATVILAVFSHRISGVMALLGMAFALPWMWLLIGGLLGGLLLVLGSLFIPGIISVFDLERFKSLFSVIPSFHPVSLSRLLSLNAGWIVEMILPYLALLGLMIAKIKDKALRFKRQEIFLIVLMGLALFPFYFMKELDFGFRIFIAIVPFLSVLYLSIISDKNIPIFKLPPKIRQLFVLIISIIFIPFSFLAFTPDKMLPYDSYNKVIENSEKILTKIEPEMVILHHGFSFYYTYMSYRHTLPFVPDWKVNITDVYRIAYNIPDDESVKYLNGVTPQPLRLSDDYVLFREDVWQTLLIRATNNRKLQFRMHTPMNPFEKRPSYLAKFQDHVTN